MTEEGKQKRYSGEEVEVQLSRSWNEGYDCAIKTERKRRAYKISQERQIRIAALNTSVNLLKGSSMDSALNITKCAKYFEQYIETGGCSNDD